MPVRGIRGATTVDVDSAQAIIEGTQELLTELIVANQIQPEDICSAYFTVTGDLTSEFPAKAARMLGWRHVPLMCAQEIAVTGSLPRCIRVLLHVNTNKGQREIRHLYLRDALSLRLDLTQNKD